VEIDRCFDCVRIHFSFGKRTTLGNTTLGQSHNDGRDIANSLIPGAPRRGKEKTEQVDPKKLQTRSVKDARFEGTLLEMGLGSTGDPNSHLQKPRSATDQGSNASKQADAGSEKDSKVSKQADTSGDKDSKGSKSTQTGDGQNTDQKATSAAADEKSSEKEKTSASKPDSNR
jgi:hypothetical protein